VFNKKSKGKMLITITLDSVENYRCLDIDTYAKKIIKKAEALCILHVDGPVNTHDGTRIRFKSRKIEIEVIRLFKTFMEAEQPTGCRIEVRLRPV
jgi:hypothetical protein